MSNAYKFNIIPLGQNLSPWLPGQTVTVGAYFDLSTTVGAAGLGSGDTITCAGMIPTSGICMLQAVVMGAPMDTNGSPSGTFSLGDSLVDGNAAARYITAGSMGKSNGNLLLVYQNVTPTITSGVYVKGVGYQYTNDENSTPLSAAKGQLNMVYTVTNAPGTAATSGIVYLYITYMCNGYV